jgi:hypothetical protein
MTFGGGADGFAHRKGKSLLVLLEDGQSVQEDEIALLPKKFGGVFRDGKFAQRREISAVVTARKRNVTEGAR